MAKVEATVEKNYPMGSFFVLWGGQAVSLLGSQIVQFALIWYLTAETGSATVLAFASLAGLLPQVLVGPIAGTLVDRWSRRWVMFWADLLVVVASAVLLILFQREIVEVWHIYLILFVRSFGGAFQNPAMMASTSLMVAPKHLTRVAGMNQALQGGLSIVAAPLGALLVEVLRMPAILAIDIGTAAFAIIPLLFITVPQPPAKPSENDTAEKSSVLTEMKEGFHYVWNWSALRSIIFIAIILNFLLNPAFSLLPLLVKNHFQGGALQLGWLESIFGVGMISGGVLLGVWGGFERKIVTSLVGIMSLGGGILLLGLAPGHLFWLAMVGMFFAGISQPIANGTIFAALQEVVDADMQGRVFTLLISLTTATTPLGLLIAGPLSDIVGIRAWFIVGGTACILMALYGTANSALLNLDQGRENS